MSKLEEQKDYLEWLKGRLWKSYFKGNANRKTLKQLDSIQKDLTAIYKILNPRNARP